ncbi:MAG: carbohydrate ABC transporter permease [Nitratireductor sp.]|nr:carbohydrate ABC transporter permease [Nitratireductor sp.]
MMPPSGALVPIFLIFNRNGLIFKDWENGIDLRSMALFDTHWGMVPLMMLFNLPIIIWMLYTYFKEIPVEILEASRMDGASLWNELTKILAPMAVPGIVSACLLSLILAWNEAFWTLNLTTRNAAPLSFLISEYTNPQGQFWAKLSAASIMAITPILVIGWFSQRQLVRGLTFGAVK